MQGSLGKNFHQTGSGDTLSLSGGLWNIASGIYSLPPTMKITFPDTINRFDKQIMVEAVVNDINGIGWIGPEIDLKPGMGIKLQTQNAGWFRWTLPEEV